MNLQYYINLYNFLKPKREADIEQLHKEDNIFTPIEKDLLGMTFLELIPSLQNINEYLNKIKHINELKNKQEQILTEIIGSIEKSSLFLNTFYTEYVTIDNKNTFSKGTYRKRYTQYFK